MPVRSSSANSSPRADRSLPLRWLLESALGPFLALALVIAFFGVADSLQAGGGNFLTARNARTISVQTATVAVAALGMTIVIIAGGIDLSAGTALALCATVLAWCLKEDVAMLLVYRDNVPRAADRYEKIVEQRRRIDREQQDLRFGESDAAERRARWKQHWQALQADVDDAKEKLVRLQAASPTVTPWTPTLAVGLAVAAGCLCGLLNGLIISGLRVVPFIVTLGTMTLYLGVAKMIARETTVRPDRTTQVPEWLQSFLSIREQSLWWGWPAGVWVALFLAVGLAAVLRYTVFSRHVFALGSNEATARLCGINVAATKIAVYTLAGFFIGVAGLYQFSRLTAGNPTSGLGMELRIIAAVVIGGGSLSGGRGSVLGTLTGAAIMAVIASGCTQLGLSNPVQDVILGVIIIAAVAIDQVRQRRLRQ